MRVDKVCLGLVSDWVTDEPGSKVGSEDSRVEKAARAQCMAVVEVEEGEVDRVVEGEVLEPGHSSCSCPVLVLAEAVEDIVVGTVEVLGIRNPRTR